jgi:hypothetical protein
MWRKIGLVVLVMVISIGIVVATAWFPAILLKPVEDQRIAFVTEDNLVDLIASVPVEMRVRKVKLDHTILSIDLIIAGKTESQVVFHDLYRIAQFAIAQTSNLNRVLVRVFETDHNADGSFPRNSLLLSTDMKRNHLDGLNKVKFDKSPNFYRKLMEAKSEITYTERWSQHFSK